jgi:hypothetical protein
VHDRLSTVDLGSSLRDVRQECHAGRAVFGSYITLNHMSTQKPGNKAVTSCHGRRAWSHFVPLAGSSAGSEVAHPPFMTFRVAASLLPVARPEPEVTPQERAQASSFTIEEALLSACHQFSSSLLITPFSSITSLSIPVTPPTPDPSYHNHTHNHASRVRTQNGLQVDQSSQAPSARPPQPAPERPFQLNRARKAGCQ